MKKLLIFLMVLVFAPVIMATTYSYTRWNDFSTGWTEVSGGTVLNMSETPNVEYPIADKSEMVFGAYSKNYNGWEAYAFGGHSAVGFTVKPALNSYFGARFQMAGEYVTSFILTDIDINAKMDVVVQVLDDAGTVLAQTATGVTGSFNETFAVSGLSTDYIDIVLKNLNPVDGDVYWDSANGFGVRLAEFTTAPIPEPATMALMALGSLCFFRRKK